MVAAIEEVRAELHQVQNRIRVMRLAVKGMREECESLSVAFERFDVVTDVLDNVNNDLTRAQRDLEG